MKETKELLVGKIERVSGPLVVASGLSRAKMFDIVKVGTEGIVGEIIEMRGDLAYIQAYESTEGLRPGDEVVSTGRPLSVELGPGLLGTIYDGVERPLKTLEEIWGYFITRGAEAPGLDRSVKWHFIPVVKPGMWSQPETSSERFKKR